jgi:hypothetical protein
MQFDPEHIKSLCKPGDYGIFNPPMDAQVALHELCHYLLGPDWYDTSGCTNQEQINTEIVCQIEKKYTGALIHDPDSWRRSKGEVPLDELPKQAIFRLGKMYFKKTSSIEVKSKISLSGPNAINLLNGHRVTILSSLYVKEVPIESVPKSGPELPFSELAVGDTFRFFDTIGRKTSDAELPEDWVKRPKSVPANFVDLVTENPCIMSTKRVVIWLRRDK